MTQIIVADKPRIIQALPFNPAGFRGDGWSIWRGPADGWGWEGKEEQDARSLELKEIDVTKILFETCLQKGEDSIKGEWKLKRLKSANRILLDARFARSFYNEPDQRTLKWLRIDKGIKWFDLPGTVLRSQFEDRCVFCFCVINGVWRLHCHWLENRYDNETMSAVLEG
ncbi:MAG: hypothetical protein Q8Q46_02290 [Candidatus Giovannonibacteria bacterium]|nr:hypothetical protein [Candidatus Giovannonibacteria bacterium]